MPARLKNSVWAGPGIRHVTVTPVFLSEPRCRAADLRLISRDDRIKAVLRVLFRQLVSDAGRCTGHDRKASAFG
jgi:hypothetical protein